MKSNYKPIGNYIQKVDHRNRDLKVTRLLGLSMTKEFRETTSNIVGTDMSVYRVMSKYQFACDFMSPIRVNKLPVVLKLDDEPNLVSPAYPVFEIKNRNELDPEYLMMWFRRSEFDRYATFKCDAAIRGGYEWTELCETMIPVPHIDKQREIVKEYNAIQNRIAVNEQMIKKLEETAKAIYREWFAEFEFPDENGKPYKSNGGKMVWCEELGKEIPKGWDKCILKEISNCLDYKRRPLSEEERQDFKGTYPYYGAMGVVDYVLEYLFDGEFLLFSEDGVNVITEKGYPSVFLINDKFWVNNHAHILEGKNGYSTRLLYSMLKEVNVSDLVTGAAQPKINQENMNSISLVKPDLEVSFYFDKKINPIFDTVQIKSKENQKLTELKALLLSRLAASGS
jgi:type I restriction enzyme S subunit